MLPERVAITRPSSGVKPIVVSTERPPAIGGQRRTRPQVAGHDPQVLDGSADHRRRPGRGVGVRQPVEPVLPKRPALAPFARDGIGRRGDRHRGVERRVEAGDRRDIGQDGAHGGDPGQRLRLVQWREVGQRAKVGDDPVIEADGHSVPCAAMDHAMTDGRDVAEARDRRGHGGRRPSPRPAPGGRPTRRWRRPRRGPAA